MSDHILKLKIRCLRAAFFPALFAHLNDRSEATYEAGLRLLDRTIELEQEHADREHRRAAAS